MENHYAQSHVGVACPNNLIIDEDEKKAVLLTRKPPPYKKCRGEGVKSEKSRKKTYFQCEV
jgi:hypothetical protein